VEWVRQCARCHHVDLTGRFASRELALGERDDGWRCERCGGEEHVPVLLAAVGGG
jgi:hypothetical protein